jgi:uncharacterized phage protein (TIGR02218 family)
MAELYKFSSSNKTWLYTDARLSKKLNGILYAAQPIKRTQWKGTLDDAQITLTMPIDLPPASLAIALYVTSTVWLYVYSTAGVMRFNGRMISATYKTKTNKCELKFTALSSVLDGEIPNRRMSRSCNWNLGDSRCGMALSSHKISVAVSATTISKNTITHSSIGAYADGYFAGGYVVCGYERQYIMGHTGTTISLLAPFTTSTSDNFVIYAGCDKSKTTCANKFSNTLNFGGYPFLPSKNATVYGI